MASIDVDQLGRELLRALRGRRSQSGLSRRLGYQSNVVYMWESGRREPSASELFRVVKRTGGAPSEAFRRFPFRVEHLDLCEREGITALLAELRGRKSIGAIAEGCRVSRFVVSRWLRGQSEPRLAELLRLIEVLTLRLLDFVAELVAPHRLPSMAAEWRELERRREVAFSHPWSHAVLRCLETRPYRSLPRHRATWIAGRLGIAADEEARCLTALREAGLIRWNGRRYVTEPVVVDTSTASPAERRALKRHWADVAARRIDDDAEGQFSWTVFAVSQADYARMRDLHVEYMNALRQLIEASAESEVVGVANVQLFPLEPAGTLRSEAHGSV